VSLVSIIVNEIMADQRQVNVIKDRIRHMKRNLIAAACPVKEGDIVTIDGEFASPRGKQMVVRHVTVLCSPVTERPDCFVVSGLVLKKDGTPGRRVGRYEIAIPKP
jgi:hypothetical protein